MKLLKSIDAYVALKRERGLNYTTGQSCLMSLNGIAGQVPLSAITSEHIIACLGVARTVASWRTRHSIVRRFLAFWALLDGEVPPAMPIQRAWIRPTFLPYVYSTLQVRTILGSAIDIQRGSNTLEGTTFRMALLLLYGTGATISEILCLRWRDVDLRRRLILVHNQRGTFTRSLLLGEDLLQALKAYLPRYRDRRDKADFIFKTKDGKRLRSEVLTWNFARLRKATGIVRSDGSPSRPTLRDFRATFAVHRITAWIQDGKNLNRMLPALATYMGQHALCVTARYLQLTPERFTKPLASLSPRKGLTPWRKDEKLMTYLAEL